MQSVDNVNNPPHYQGGSGIECIDAIEAALGREGFIAFLRGQVIRYQWRLGRKDSAVQDAGKARWYAMKLEEVLRVGKTEEDGWIEWKGGERPVDGSRMVDIKLRDGNIFEGCKPSYLFWMHTGGASDIVAYRFSIK